MLRRVRLGLPVGGSLTAGLLASVCCGGSLVFASLGLGAAYGALGLWQVVPQVLAAGALSTAALNYLFFRRAAARALAAGAPDTSPLRRRMLASAAFGVFAMAASFVLLEWLNHAVVHPEAFLSQPVYGQALVPGVPNVRLLYVAASFAALVLLWALPFPGRAASEMSGAVRVGLLSFASLVLALMLVGVADVVAAMDASTTHRPAPHQRP